MEPRTVSLKVEMENGKVTLSRSDFERILKHVTDRSVEVQQVTTVLLKPKTARKGRPKKQATNSE